MDSSVEEGCNESRDAYATITQVPSLRLLLDGGIIGRQDGDRLLLGIGER